MAEERLLVADDESQFRDFVRRAATAMGYVVAVCDDSTRFFDHYDVFRPTVIVLDIVMPEVEGTEIVRQLAERKTDARILLVTGFNPHYVEAARLIAQSRGIVRIECLTKPVRLDRLCVALGHGDAGPTTADRLAVAPVP